MNKCNTGVMNPVKRDDNSPPRLSTTRHPGIRPPNNFDPAPVGDVDAWFDALEDRDDEGEYWHRVDMDRIPFPVWIRLGMSIEDGFVITGMLLGDPDGEVAIGTGALNKIAINDILESVARLDQADDLLRDTAHEFVGEVRRPGGQAQDNDAFREAARVYTLAQWSGSRALIGVVANALRVSRATASRRVQRARELGFVAAERTKLEQLDSKHVDALGIKYGIDVLPPPLRPNDSTDGPF